MSNRERDSMPPDARWSCGTCQHAEWPEADVFECRRFPPRADAAGMAVWPRVTSDLWCGEYAHDADLAEMEASAGLPAQQRRRGE
jgi:hypothetical protein